MEAGQKKREDIGPVNHEKHLGILLHLTIAVTPERLCLGVTQSGCRIEKLQLATKKRFDACLSLYMMKFKQKSPKEPPTLNVMLKLIASFGGYLNRKNDKEPGPTTLWIGLQRMQNFIAAHQAFSEISGNTYG